MRCHNVYHAEAGMVTTLNYLADLGTKPRTTGSGRPRIARTFPSY